MRLIALLGIAFPAVAAAAPLPASQHKPPLVLDETSVQLDLYGQGEDGYRFRNHVEVNGFTSTTDSLKLEWTSKGKVLATAKCDIGIDDGYASGSCGYDGTSLKATGPIEARLIYWDDQEEKEYLVRTFKVTVHHWKGVWDTWQIAPDDVLSSAWIYMGNDEEINSTYRQPALYLWFTNDIMPNPVLRCKVGEKKLADIKLSDQLGSETGGVSADYGPKKGDRVTYNWTKKKMLIEVFWGSRKTLDRGRSESAAPDSVMSDNPGKWECGLRHEGKTIRILNFTVDADGMIQQDEIQSGKNPIPTVSEKVVLIDVRLTKDSSTFDTRINPAAMKKSMGFGLPWPDHPKVKAIHASYPAKSGLADPPK